MKFLVINGPNLNLTQFTEPGMEGQIDFNTLLDYIEAGCAQMDVQVDFFQSNHEGALVDRIQEAYFEKVDGIVINPAAYTHTSVALLDAVKAVKIPAVEVHISQVSEREEFRQISYIRAACVKTIAGQGVEGYCQAVRFLKQFLLQKVKP